MLPSIQRLSRPQVSVFLANPSIKVIFNRLGTFKYIPSPTTQFTVVTGSKQQKRAVARNKIRRQLYSIMRQYKDSSFTGMLHISKNAYEMDYATLKQHFYGLLHQIKKNS